MRALSAFSVLVVLCVLFGWPDHWVLAGAAFAAGWLASRRPYLNPYVKRPGYVHTPAAETDLTRRVGRYTAGNDPLDGLGI